MIKQLTIFGLGFLSGAILLSFVGFIYMQKLKADHENELRDERLKLVEWMEESAKAEMEKTNKKDTTDSMTKIKEE